MGGILMMRLHKGDLVELEDPDGERRVKRVVRLRVQAGALMLVEHKESGDIQARHEDTADYLRWDNASIRKLRDRGAKKIYLNAAGMVQLRAPKKKKIKR
jgi:3-dehydroquinate synthase class II